MMHSYLDGTIYRVCIVCLSARPDHCGLGLASRQSLNQVHIFSCTLWGGCACVDYRKISSAGGLASIGNHVESVELCG